MNRPSINNTKAIYRDTKIYLDNKATSTVQINYEGQLIDGTVFDSSIARQQPVTLKISDVVTGLAQGLLTMKEGGKSRFFIPAKLGYGTYDGNLWT